MTYWPVTQALARPNDLIYLAINIIATKRMPLSLISYILRIAHTLTFSPCSLRKLAHGRVRPFPPLPPPSIAHPHPDRLNTRRSIAAKMSRTVDLNGPVSTIRYVPGLSTGTGTTGTGTGSQSYTLDVRLPSSLSPSELAPTRSPFPPHLQYVACQAMTYSYVPKDMASLLPAAPLSRLFVMHS